MAKNIKINGVTYNGVTSLKVPLSTSGDTIFPETSDATAGVGDIYKGKSAYAGGVKLTGTMSIDDKADKVADAIDGNLAGLDTTGNLTDSGKKAADFATRHITTRQATSHQGRLLLRGAAQERQPRQKHLMP